MVDDWVKRAVGVLRGAETTDAEITLALETFRNATVRCDFPMPASPDSSTAWPSPSFAFDQRRRSNSYSSSRPTRVVIPLGCSASKRLVEELGRSTAQTCTGAAMPFKSLVPRSSSSKSCPRSLRVPSLITTMLGLAMLWRRAARFGVSPTMLGVRLPTTTTPVAMPTLTCWRSHVFSPATASMSSSPALTACSASSS